ncbi:ABC transporter permease [Nitrospirillum viridazoti]|uniref:Transport permease protein n=1 Tax=Nitrospirillum viridazoti CBAmc TaxID=1441467 RepID=A0A248JYJ7_9PROT|nr:ABC transporter permease [Nitrospirillum amazonense]ASG23787.1 phosphate ABC transporter permease [Nitrospirillum amazonense CBAmc]TWB44802.1 lipopolysaccharide transport system permease protein [Nitrospirillum amazonense]
MSKGISVRDRAPAVPPSLNAGTPPDATLITAQGPGLLPWLMEAWRTRRIALMLARRSLKARYRQTWLGAGWAILQPLLLMLVYWGIFGHLLGVPTGGDTPYPVFAFTGLVLWQFFSRALMDASASILHQAHFVTKVYFPRLHMPLASLMVAAVDMAAGLVCLALLLAAFRIWPEARWLLLLGPLALLLVTGAGAALVLSALVLRFRDVGHLLPLTTQVLMVAAPVIYPAHLVHGVMGTLYRLNPMVTVIEGARAALLDTPAPEPVPALLSVALAAGLLLLGLRIVRRTEPAMADLI